MKLSMGFTNWRFDYLQEHGYHRYDASYYSNDCFHPARKMHQSMASALWDSMVPDRCAHYDKPNTFCLFAILVQL